MNARGDIRHTFVIFWVLLLVCWFVVAGAIGVARIATAYPSNSSVGNYTNYSGNISDSNLTELVETSGPFLQDWLGNLFSDPENWIFAGEFAVITGILVLIGILAGVYIAATVFFGVGG